MDTIKKLNVATVVAVVVAIIVVAVADALNFGPSRIAAKIAAWKAKV